MFQLFPLCLFRISRDDRAELRVRWVNEIGIGSPTCTWLVCTLATSLYTYIVKQYIIPSIRNTWLNSTHIV